VPAAPEPFTGLLVAFAGELRAAGLAVGSGDVLVYGSALSRLDPADLADLYWAGRTTLVNRHDDIAVYDQVFRRFFLGAGGGADDPLMPMLRASARAQGALAIPATEPGKSDQEEQAVLGWMASDVDALKHKSFATCTPEELAALRRIMARIKLIPPRRRTRRSTPARTGPRPDPRRVVREAMRMHGEPARLYWRRRKVRPRPLVLILDISGSMADYSRSLLQFAHAAARSTGRVEVFCFGTRLTRMTGAMQCRRPDEALERAARAAFDWDGGTRIGDSLDSFVKGWARRGVCRGAVVVLCSDGLDRGDPAVLAAALERLSRLCHRLVWLNPHKGEDPGFKPSTLGMMIAAPHIDLLLSGHDLNSLEKFATLLPMLNLEHADQERAVRWSVGIEAETGQVLTREQVVELADAVAASGGSASGIGTSRCGARLIVQADSHDEAVAKAAEQFTRAVALAGLPPGPVVRTEAVSEDEDEDAG
jgi:uncharacterized protein with von Willebrand factor type A (vWA) domain